MVQSRKKLNGFSIAEVMIAAFVLVIGVFGTTNLIAMSLKNSFENRDTIVATELAQEGVELVRNVRDNDFALGNNGFTGFLSSNKHCRINYNSVALVCDSNIMSLSYALSNDASGFYAHGNVAPEKFSRYIYVDYNGTDTATIKSFVYWGSGSDTSVFSLNDTKSGVNYIGNTTKCTIARKCVFTEVTLTNWN